MMKKTWKKMLKINNQGKGILSCDFTKEKGVDYFHVLILACLSFLYRFNNQNLNQIYFANSIRERSNII